MRRALTLGAAQSGLTAENPAVGCVLVKDGEIIGEGATQDGGRPHAETVALQVAGRGARGATAYVTLEPCSHYGQTAPCANALIEAGIARCFIAVVDPDPRVNWRGAALLQEAGIDVRVGLCEAEAAKAHAAFFARVSQKRMKFWELTSVFRGNETLLRRALSGTKFATWVDNPSREQYDFKIPFEICVKALSTHPDFLYKYSDNHLRSYIINKIEWKKAGNPAVEMTKMSYLEVFKSYGGHALEDTLEKGSFRL